MTTPKRSKKTTTLTRADRLRIVGVSLCDERTVAGIYSGRRTTSTAYERVSRAAAELKLPSPPPFAIAKVAA